VSAMRGGAGHPTSDMFPRSVTARPTVVGASFAVAAGHPLVAQAAVSVLARGGNAVDAGVAAGLAANVVEVPMCNLGGIAPILVRPSGSEEVWSVAGVGSWSRHVTLSSFVDEYGGDIPLGVPAAIVPGAPAAWITALQKFGTWAFVDVAEPARALAEEGFVLDSGSAGRLAACAQSFQQWESSRRVYLKDGREPRVGAHLRQPELAGLISSMAEAERGSSREEALENVGRYFYEGEVAERIVSFVQENGGKLDLADMSAFECEVSPAPQVEAFGHRVFECGAWSQGPALLQALVMLRGRADRLGTHNSPDYIELVTQALRLALRDRDRYYGDPNHVDVDLERLLSEEHATAQWAGASSHVRRTARAGAHRRPDTTYLCVIDEAGTVFSASASDTLDASPIVPDLGLIVSPRGLQSSLDEKSPNAIGPQKRPRVTPAPALALRDAPTGRLPFAFGSPGGDVILQAMIQSFLNVALFGMDAQQAVEEPRFAVFDFQNSFFPHETTTNVLYLEEPLWADLKTETARGLRVEQWPAWEFDAGGVCLALESERPDMPGRYVSAGADPRRSCYALAC
jgi:gamma-glutamyltranspeptidase/glutathione hydrolase